MIITICYRREGIFIRARIDYWNSAPIPRSTDQLFSAWSPLCYWLHFCYSFASSLGENTITEESAGNVLFTRTRRRSDRTSECLFPLRCSSSVIEYEKIIDPLDRRPRDII